MSDSPESSLLERYKPFHAYQLEADYHRRWDEAKTAVREERYGDACEHLRHVMAMGIAAALNLESVGLKLKAHGALKAVGEAHQLATRYFERWLDTHPEEAMKWPSADIEGMGIFCAVLRTKLETELPAAKGCGGAAALGIAVAATVGWIVH